MTCSAFEIQFSSSFLFDLSLSFPPVFSFSSALVLFRVLLASFLAPPPPTSFFAPSRPSFFLILLAALFSISLSSLLLHLAISPTSVSPFSFSRLPAFRRVLRHQHSFFITHRTRRFLRMKRCLGPFPGSLSQRFSGPCPRCFYLLKIFARVPCLPFALLPRGDRDLVFVVEWSPFDADRLPLCSSPPLGESNSPPSPPVP